MDTFEDSKITDVAILGYGGNCFDVADAIEAINSKSQKYRLAGFFDDSDNKKINDKYPPILGKINDAQHFKDLCFVNAIGSTRSFKLKEEIIKRSGINNERFISIIHPRAVVSPSATIKNGTVILAGVNIGPSVAIGHHVMILQNSVIGHDSIIGDYSIIAAGAVINGNVTVKPSVFIGAKSVVLENRTLESNSLLGAGAVLTKDLSKDAIAKGNPAK
ncbi:MAG: acetyltransferase [Deltaproteobacteria bacterium]|nr:acetyltransferase [Deltaproteobacteria bacterium]